MREPRIRRLASFLLAVAVAAAVALGILVAGTASALISPAGARAGSGSKASAAASRADVVGALFITSSGHLGRHFCTASVVHSASGNVIITAAHCMAGVSLSPPYGVVFAPGYHDGRFPLGLWTVTSDFVTTNWTVRRDPNDDVAFLIVSSPGRRPLEQVTGAERLGLHAVLPATIEAIGYPDTADQPVSCSALALEFRTTGLHQLTFTCGGFTNGTSGGPLLSDVSQATGEGTIIGVIGGYQQGGDTADVSYSARFSENVAALYQLATSPTRDPEHRNDPI